MSSTESLDCFQRATRLHSTSTRMSKQQVPSLLTRHTIRHVVLHSVEKRLVGLNIVMPPLIYCWRGDRRGGGGNKCCGGAGGSFSLRQCSVRVVSVSVASRSCSVFIQQVRQYEVCMLALYV